MRDMNNVEMVAHALCDYVRPQVDSHAFNQIESSIAAGEPYDAILTALSICVTYGVALPPSWVDSVKSVQGFRPIESEFLTELIPELPRWSLVA